MLAIMTIPAIVNVIMIFAAVGADRAAAVLWRNVAISHPALAATKVDTGQLAMSHPASPEDFPT